MMHVLIDADVLAFVHAATGDRDIYGDDGEFLKHEVDPLDWHTHALKKQVEDIMEACGGTSYTMFLSGKDNFRFDVAKRKPYKGNRKAERPYHLENIRAHIRGHYYCILSDGCEADDEMAMAQTFLNKSLIDSVIATIDKDLPQVEGNHYRWESYGLGEKKLYKVEGIGELVELPKKVEGNGYLYFCCQILTGDNADNIPGLPLCGPKKAYKALCDAVSNKEAFGIVRQLYADKYGETADEELTEQATLLWMIRERDDELNLIHFNLQEHIDGYKESAAD